MGPGRGGTEAAVYRQSPGRRLSISLGTYATVLHAEINAMLACAYEIHVYVQPEKYVSTCSGSQAGLKAFQAAKTTSKLVQQCQKALNDISNQHSVGLFRVPPHPGAQGNEIADELTREGTVHQFARLEPTGVGGLVGDYKKKDKILDGQPAYSNVAGSHQYSETGLKTGFGLWSHC